MSEFKDFEERFGVKVYDSVELDDFYAINKAVRTLYCRDADGEYINATIYDDGGVKWWD